MSDAAYHETRLTVDKKRDKLWASLWRFYFSRLISPEDCVVDLGCGHGHFINEVVSKRRIAVDSWPGFRTMVEPGVEAVVCRVTELDFLPDGCVDFAFGSNIFEHLTRQDFESVLAQLRKKLSARGTLTLLQPNYRYAYREYFDDYTHLTVYSHVSMCDLLAAKGYEVIDLKPRFLPLTIKSRWPVSSWLIAAYLASPIKPLGKQMLIRARPR